MANCILLAVNLLILMDFIAAVIGRGMQIAF